MEEMRERVRELEIQLAEREKLIESLDVLRREQQQEVNVFHLKITSI
jgi:uncharacterized coiled-coil protein SlyX